MQATKQHAHWSSRFTFLMAAIGSAVGLGNIWRFPFIAGENGGGAFILIYLVTTLAIGLPILVAEVMLGRMGAESPINAMIKLARTHRRSMLWVIIGLGGTFGAFVIVSYYSVIGGWALKYLLEAATGGFHGLTAETSGAMFDDFTGSASALTVWHSAFMAINIGIVAWGVHNGIERAVSVMMPLLFALLVAMAIYAAGTPGSAEATEFFFSADFSKVTPKTFLIAIGQGFFSVGVALGSMMAYGAYLDEQVSIPKSAVIIVLADTGVAILAGFVIFPLVFTFALEPGAGAGLVFATLPIAFGQMDNGVLIGTLFFLLLTVAAITSAISLLEPTIAWADEKFETPRPQLAFIVGVSAWGLGLATVLSFNLWSKVFPLASLGVLEDKTFFDVFDFSVTSLVMPTIGLLIALFAGWALSKETVQEALGVGDSALFTLWRFSLRVLVPLAILGIFLSNLLTDEQKEAIGIFLAALGN